MKTEPTEENTLRHVELTGTGYKLLTWDTHTRCRTGQWLLGYRFTSPKGETLFEGEDYGCAPSDPVDSDRALRGLLGFLTLKPGDTDRDYFKSYTEAQMAFAKGDAEELSLWAMEEDDEPPGFTDL